MVNHPVLDQLDTALRDRIPAEPVEFAGEWSEASRRTYTSEAQLGTGAGPFMDVVDLRWRGALPGASPMGGMGFLLTSGNLYWAKAPEISPSISVDLSLHAYAQSKPGGATFTASIAGAYLPGVPVSVGSDLADACRVEQDPVIRTGRLSCLARAGSAAFFVLLFPRGLLKVGRKHLWRLRDEIASSLPAASRELLTRRRAGGFPLPD